MRKTLVVLVALSILIMGASSLAGRQGLMTGFSLVVLLFAVAFLVSQYRKKPSGPTQTQDQFLFEESGVSVPEPEPQPQARGFGFSGDSSESDFDIFGPSQPSQRSMFSTFSSVISAIVSRLSTLSIPSMKIFAKSTDLDFLNDTTSEPEPEPEIVEMQPSVSSPETESESVIEEEETLSEEAPSMSESSEEPEPPPPVIQRRVESGLIEVGEPVAFTPLTVLLNRGWVKYHAPYTKVE